MPSPLNASLGPYNIDSHLIAAVQINAGARCHESANLLNCYYLSAQTYGDALSREDDETAQWAIKILQDSEVSLRKFLFQCRQLTHPRDLANELIESHAVAEDWKHRARY